VAQDNSIELGLRARVRGGSSVAPSANTYTVQATTGQASGSCSNNGGTCANWNYDFSVNLRPNGVGTLQLSQVNITLSVTDMTSGATGTVDVQATYADSSGFGANGENDPSEPNGHPAFQPTDWALQNSENLAFNTGSPLAAAKDPTTNAAYAFNPTGDGTYQFVLTVARKSDGTVLASDTIVVSAVGASNHTKKRSIACSVEHSAPSTVSPGESFTLDMSDFAANSFSIYYDEQTCGRPTDGFPRGCIRSGATTYSEVYCPAGSVSSLTFDTPKQPKSSECVIKSTRFDAIESSCTENSILVELK